MKSYKTHKSSKNPAGLCAEAMSVLASSAGIGLWNWHIPSNEMFMNREITMLTGYELDDLPQNGFTRRSMILEEDRAYVEHNVKACIIGEQDSYTIEYRMYRRDGSIVSIRESAISYERDEKGRAVRLAAMVTDLSDLRMAEKKARVIQKENMRLSRASSYGDIVEQNRLQQAVISSASMIIGGFYQDYEVVIRQALQVLGESIGVDRVYIWRNVEDAGNLYCFKRSQWYKNTPSKHSPTDGVRLLYQEVAPEWAIDLKKRHTITGTVDELKNRLTLPGLLDVVSIMLLPMYLHGIFWGFIGFDDCTTARQFTEIEQEIMTAGGQIVASSIARNEALKKLDAARIAAMSSTKAKGDFLSRMSHEIRTPINAIIGMTTIARQSDNLDKIRYSLDKAQASSRQLLNIINDVLDMSKIDANKFDISLAPFDFEKMLQNVYSVVQVKLAQKHQIFSFDFDYAFTCQIISDELRLSQVLINLLNNAVKFTPNKGEIKLKIRVTEINEGKARLHCEVIDTGIGIDEAGKKRLFQSFEQADGNVSRHYGGTGLGLAISKKIIDLMGGAIWVESEIGKGARFIFEFDFSWGDKLSLKPVGSRLNLSDPTQLNILVVDDSWDVLEYFQNVLAGFSLGCDIASSGQQGVEAIRRKSKDNEYYHIVFLDWNMPDMSGDEVAREINELSPDKTTVVMISVADWGDIEHNAKSAGIHNFLSKPVLPSVLYNKIVELTSNTFITGSADNGDAMHQNYNWQDKKLLLVEDIEINMEIIESILEETGIKIDFAMNGQEALLQCNQNPIYDIILMDVQMPVMDGLEATQKIRQMDNSWAKQVPIVAMTANAFKEDVDICLAAGMNAHIAKPIEITQLYKVMDNALRNL